MPLIIHPSSACDVCLETFSYGDLPPHAIPCGHIFCRGCLLSLTPASCPLCRKPYNSERIKKLITGEMEGVEEGPALNLMKRLIESLDTPTRSITSIEVEQWLSNNTNASVLKALNVCKEYVVLKAERIANVQSIRRLQRQINYLEVNQSYEKENASNTERMLQSQLAELQSYVQELEEHHRTASPISFRHNPLPTPPEPFPLETLPFFASRQQNIRNQEPSDPWPSTYTQSALHLNGVSAGHRSEVLAPPRHSSPDQASVLASTISETADRNTIIPGASPGQRFVPHSVFEELNAAWPTSMSQEQSASVADPFTLATEYITEYAEGYEEAYRLSQRPLESSSSHRRHSHSVNEPLAPDVPSPLSVVNEYRATPDEPRPPVSSRPSRRFGLEDFYPASMLPDRREVSSTTPTQLEPTTGTTINPFTRRNPSDTNLQAISNAPSLALSSHWEETASTGFSRSSPPPPTSAPASLAVAAFPEDDASSQSSQTSNSSRTRARRRRSDVAGFGVLYNSVLSEEAPVLPDPISSIHRRSTIDSTPVQTSPVHWLVQSVLRMPDQSPMSVSSMSSWGTIDTLNRSPQGRPFRPAHEIEHPHDLRLRLFDDLSSASQSQRSSIISDIGIFPGANFGPRGSSDSGDIQGSRSSDSQNRTPRVVPQPLPELDSPALTASSRASDTHWDASGADLPYRDRNQHQHQHHGPSVSSDLRSLLGQSSSNAPQRQSSISISDRSSRASRHRTSRLSISTTNDENPASPGWDTPPPASNLANALGLTDISASPEPRISAPTPITPSRQFLRSYSNGSHR